MIIFSIVYNIHSFQSFKQHLIAEIFHSKHSNWNWNASFREPIEFVWGTQICIPKFPQTHRSNAKKKVVPSSRNTRLSTYQEMMNMRHYEEARQLGKNNNTSIKLNSLHRFCRCKLQTISEEKKCQQTTARFFKNISLLANFLRGPVAPAASHPCLINSHCNNTIITKDSISHEHILQERKKKKKLLATEANHPARKIPKEAKATKANSVSG